MLTTLRSRSARPELVPLQQVIQLAIAGKLQSNTFTSENGIYAFTLLDNHEKVFFIADTWDDYTGVTLLDICYLSKHGQVSGAIWLVNFTNVFSSLFVSDDSLQHLNKFIDKITIEELIQFSHPQFVLTLLAYDGSSILRTHLPSHLKAEYIDRVCEELIATHVPSILLDGLNLDLVQTAPYKFKSEVEGDWELEEAKAFFASQVSIVRSEEEREEIQKLAACLRKLETLAYSQRTDLIVMLQKRLGKPNDFIKELLPLNIISARQRYLPIAHLPVRREIDPENKSEINFCVTFRENASQPLMKLQWNSSIKLYIEQFNWVPSQQFLKIFEKFLSACRTSLLQHAIRFKCEVLMPSYHDPFKNVGLHGLPLLQVTISRGLQTLQSVVNNADPVTEREQLKKTLLQKLIIKIMELAGRPGEFFKAEFLLQFAQAFFRLNLDDPDLVAHFRRQYIHIVQSEKPNRILFQEVNRFSSSSFFAYFKQIGSGHPDTLTATRLLVEEVNNFLKRYAHATWGCLRSCVAAEIRTGMPLSEVTAESKEPIASVASVTTSPSQQKVKFHPVQTALSPEALIELVVNYHLPDYGKLFSFHHRASPAPSEEEAHSKLRKGSAS